ncbi:MAG: hypothetical protein FWD24_01275 [Treponema sp.]|nr:hypothetical protein [Treponema sp.]
MKKIKIAYKCLFIILVICLFSSFGNIIEEINEFGGITTVINNDNLLENPDWLRVFEYYDNNNNLVKAVIIFTETFTKKSGLLEQVNYFIEGNIIGYEMFYSEEHRKMHYFNRAIEMMGQNRIVYRTIWFIDEDVIDVIDYPQGMNDFQFYNLNYIENALYEFYEPDSQRNSSVVSARYYNIRSIIKFDNEFAELNESDRNILNYFTAFGGISPGFLENFKKKVRVYHEDKSYWFFVHSQLEQNINGQYATISYYPLLWNGELYLLGIGLFSHN